jgi:hypothetical protein
VRMASIKKKFVDLEDKLNINNKSVIFVKKLKMQLFVYCMHFEIRVYKMQMVKY